MTATGPASLLLHTEEGGEVEVSLASGQTATVTWSGPGTDAVITRP